MPRTAPSVATRPSSDRAAVELLDRTGIVAASLPKRRRTDDELSELAEPIYTRPPVCDQDLRPKSVVIRRRARTWLGSGAAVLLVAAGWAAGGLLSGSLFTQPPPDDVAQVDPRPAVAAAPAPQPQPQPQAQAVAPPPSTVFVPVPAKQETPKRVQVQAKAQPKKAPAEEDVPRVDLPPSTTPSSSADPVRQWMTAAESMMQQYQYRSESGR
jgi:outer membrane biosynthesis protein TonB